MIYSASRRTDLVAFYPDYIVEKVRRSRKLEAIVFWTKDPRNLIDHAGLRAVLERIPAVVQLTVTGLAGTPWEPAVPAPRLLAPALRDLAQCLPSNAVVWRFDPIILTPDLFERFDAVHDLLCSTLGPPEAVTVSFVDAYAKVCRRVARSGLTLPLPTPTEERDILSSLHDHTALSIHLCCEPHLLDLPGVCQAACVDGSRFDRLYNTDLSDLPPDHGQRPACGCVRSTDIGSYDQPCGHRCRYCYACPDA